MKKQISKLAAAIGFAMLSAPAVHAQVVLLSPAATTGIETSAGTGANKCDVLASNVSVSTSNKVYGAIDCRVSGVAAGGKIAPAAIGVGTCHFSGSTKYKTFTCVTATAPAGSVDATCADAGGGVISGTYGATAPSMFLALSTGGSASAQAMSTACAPANATTSADLGTAVTAATTAGLALITQ